MIVSADGMATSTAGWVSERLEALRDDPRGHQRADGVVEEHVALRRRRALSSARYVVSLRVSPPSRISVTLA